MVGILVYLVVLGGKVFVVLVKKWVICGVLWILGLSVM